MPLKETPNMLRTKFGVTLFKGKDVKIVLNITNKPFKFPLKMSHMSICMSKLKQLLNFRNTSFIYLISLHVPVCFTACLVQSTCCSFNPAFII